MSDEPEQASLKKRINIYLNAYDLLEGEISMRLDAIASCFEREEVQLHEETLKYCLQYFQSNCLKFWSSLGVEEPSHLKVFGHLLYSLTQLRDELTGERLFFCGIVCESATVGGADSIEWSEEDFSRAFFHEYASFVVVYEMLASAQRQRKENLKFDPLRPPTNHRFVRSMIDYIREWRDGPLSGDRSPFDFYMIFKSMDLYGVETQY